MKKMLMIIAVIVVGTGLLLLSGAKKTASAQESLPPDPSSLEVLGKLMFFDPALSINGAQSCASCHDPQTGFTGPDSLVNFTDAIYGGALAEHYGNRKPPTAAYASESPELGYDEGKTTWFGGMFWDGRATGWTLHDPLAEQAQGPFLNPLEQAIPNEQILCVKVKQAEYSSLFTTVWGTGSLNCAKDSLGVYERIGRSIAAYEHSTEVNPFTSKFDLFWENATLGGKDVTKIRCGTMSGGMGGGMDGGGMGAMCAPKDADGTISPESWQSYRNLGLNNMELQGLAIFNDPTRANCAFCHSLAPGENGYPLFTDFSFHNLGIPKNPDNPFYEMPEAWNPDGADWVDTGLGGYLMSAGFSPEVYNVEEGKFKTPSLRNVDLRPADDFVKAYTHNGYFKSLQEIIIFYAWRGLVMNGGLGMGGSGMDGCVNGGMGGGGMGGGGMVGGITPEMMCSPDLFPAPEVNRNLTPMNHFNIMSDTMKIESFLKTLSDGYVAP